MYDLFSGAIYPVRREYYAHTSPAAKGARWEWSSGPANIDQNKNGNANTNTSPNSTFTATDEWHIYDMEVQTVIEESWATGEQTIDIGQHFPGCPYIINFCNFTQVRRTTGVVRQIRRAQCASYPLVKLTPVEIGCMLQRKEQRRLEFAAEVERRMAELKSKKLKRVKGGTKKAMKHFMNHILHPSVNLKELREFGNRQKQSQNSLTKNGLSSLSSRPSATSASADALGSTATGYSR